MNVADIESLDRESRGVAHVEGKAVFIDGALPGERVEYSPYVKKPSYDLGQLIHVIEPSAARVDPRCLHYGVCGGCSLQHMDPRAQIAAKQRVLEDALWHIGRVRPESMLPPIQGPSWRYRNRARLSARFVVKKGGAMVGFRERKSTYVADMNSCEVLPESVSALIPKLRELIGSLSVRDRLPQIEVAIGETATVLVLRILQPLVAADEAALKTFADTNQVQLWLQPAGPDTAAAFWPKAAHPLFYSLPEFDVRIGFSPTEFTQVNEAVNRMLVRRALMLLDPRPGERIGDFFCGLGNFTLPIARMGASVTGYESSPDLVRRARENAEANGLEDAARFEAANLYDRDDCGRIGAFDKALLDPPRSGAMELIKSFSGREPRRVVYVSCDPATLARDAGMLVQTLGYELRAAGVVNMFPHTSHVESVALLERG
jgi:23S rRNA (uracil1939-C5)-methyltransferase